MKTTIQHPGNITADQLCLCDRRRAPLHSKADHATINLLQEFVNRCSVCDLPWGEGAYSEHERCVWSVNDERHYAEMILVAQDATGARVELRYCS